MKQAIGRIVEIENGRVLVVTTPKRDSRIFKKGDAIVLACFGDFSLDERLNITKRVRSRR